jgi:hypothetical protein
MARVEKYHVLFYGSPEGYMNKRAQIALFEGGDIVGFIRFHDPGMPFPDERESDGKVFMHLPSDMLGAVIDVLRNERPIDIDFRSGRAFLGTALEVVGEAEG